jgi:hypothetical protein
MITYLTFTTEYPAYAALPYDQTIVEMRLKEISLLFPQIDSCLPEDTRLLATFYAYRVLDLEEDCDMEIGLVSVSSLNTTVWGNRLARLYRIHGCHVNAAPSKSRGCGDC